MNHKQQIHEWIKAFTPIDTVVDMTAGNGYDTLFLAQHAKHVIAIDIQEDAIIATQERCKNHDNITYNWAQMIYISLKLVLMVLYTI